jgi:hypothetical protein
MGDPDTEMLEGFGRAGGVAVSSSEGEQLLQVLGV